MNQIAQADAQRVAYRAKILSFKVDPHDPGNFAGAADSDEAVEFEEDGLLIVEGGRVVARGAYSALAGQLESTTTVRDLRGNLIVPGFIDTHVHYPQTDMIASPAPGLLPWLERYTFPTERGFTDRATAQETATFFLDTLLACGTTTALVYCTVHKESADAFFAESEARDLRMIAGKVLMDRHCPDFLRDTAQSGYDDSAELIARWHGRGRQLYALTPRFAPTSTPEQLEACGALARRHGDVFIQTHVAENVDEVKWVAELFPGYRSYLDVYDRYGLLRRRAVYGHCIHLDAGDRLLMAQAGAIASHCPTSNLFLGSGLFDMHEARANGMAVALGTDVGGGTSFSMLQTMNEAYKVASMTGHHLSATRMFWLATAGAAQALDLDEKIGTLAPGTEADFIVLDPTATPLLARRTARAESLEEWLFAFALLGDDRAVLETYAAGQCLHQRNGGRREPD